MPRAKKFAIWITDAALAKDLKVQAAIEGRSVTALVTEALRAHLTAKILGGFKKLSDQQLDTVLGATKAPRAFKPLPKSFSTR